MWLLLSLSYRIVYDGNGYVLPKDPPYHIYPSKGERFHRMTGYRLNDSYHLWSLLVVPSLVADSIQLYGGDGRRRNTRNKRCQERNTRKTTTKENIIKYHLKVLLE